MRGGGALARCGLADLDHDDVLAGLLRSKCRAQKALADSEARYRDLVSRCPALVCEITPRGETIFVNDAIRTLLGYEPDELLGKQWWEVLVPNEHLGQARKLSGLVLRQDVTGFELPLRTDTGEYRWILWTTANRYSDDGELEAVIAFGIDVTERRKADETARELHDAQLEEE